MRFLLLSLLSSTTILGAGCLGKTTEICDDGIDNDGNDSVDCGDEACVEDAVCVDADNDGVPVKDDCDDSDPSSYPGADELCDGIDNNCNEEIDDNPINGDVFYQDLDGDGFGGFDSLITACEISEGLSASPEDCDDANPDINPNAEEVCDEIDNNCDFIVDSDASDRNTYYRDTDNDGFGDDAAIQEACSLPSGFSEQGGDCDNRDPAVNPTAEELCDGIDNNCDGDTDIGATDGSPYYADSDGDGYGDPNAEVRACEQLEGYVLDQTDCDDSNADANPEELEICDGVDNDCDGVADDDDPSLIQASTFKWYLDADGDGFGEIGSTFLESCAAPLDTASGNPYVDNDTDCDDTNVSTYPGAPEFCDGFDNDCDESIDNKPSDAVQYYVDADGDGFGDDSQLLVSCEDPNTASLSYVTVGGDCDDTDPSFNPGVTDTCDGLDQNCSGDESDASGNNVFYLDQDNDGYGSTVSSVMACEAPNNFVSDGSDCDDRSADVNPGAAEICDGIDNDCDGALDQDDSSFDTASLISYYFDADGDGYGDPAISQQACEQPLDHVLEGTDCNDDPTNGAAFNPGVAEIWYDGIDQDCDGLSDYDQDGDGEDSREYLGSCSDTQFDNQIDCEDAGTCSSGQYADIVSCENNGATWTSAGNEWTATGTDCDDYSAARSAVDQDGDGYSTCDGDCNDSAEDLDEDGVVDGLYTYPGAAENEVDSSLCLTDRDEDGYGDSEGSRCFNFILNDSYGDGWNGSAIEIYEDTILTGSVANQDLDGIFSNSSSGGEVNEVSYCFASGTSLVELGFVAGTWVEEISFEIYDESGVLLGSGQGDVSDQLTFDGMVYVDGDRFYSQLVLSGTDCDDSDATIGSIDADADGALDCTVDCDPSDPTLNAEDQDGDGYSSCTGDCDDDNDNVHPGAVDIWYDGVDTDCDGADDFDQDGDGERSASAGYCDDPRFTTQADCETAGECDDPSYDNEIDCINNGLCTDTQYTDEISCIGAAEEWSDNNWTVLNNTWSTVNGDDCDDTDPEIYAAAVELCDGIDNNCDGLVDDADPNMPTESLLPFYEDHDGDGYGADATVIYSCSMPTPAAGATFTYTAEGGDCNDDTNANGAAFHPGVTETYYDGIDSDCSGGSDYDADGDGYLSAAYFSFCSDEQYDTQEDCESAGICSDSQYSTQEDCQDNDGTWTAEIWTAATGGQCSDAQYTTQEDCEAAGSCADIQYSTQEDCEGNSEIWTPEVWTRGEAGICSEPEFRNQSDCESAGSCSDTQHSTQEDCEDSNETWTAGVWTAEETISCSDPQHSTQEDCEDAGSCSDEDLTTQADCEAAGSCSDVQYTTQADCETNSETWTAEMWTTDGNTWGRLAFDCDDDVADLSPEDRDGDGFSSCDGDCNDIALDTDEDGVADGFHTYPGAAYNEVDTEACTTDKDGDGWSGSTLLGCYTFTAYDSWGDGWNGNALEIYEDGVLTASIANQNLDGVFNNTATGGESQDIQHCFDVGSQEIEIVFVDGSYNSEIAVDIYDDNGILIGSGEGSGTDDLIFEGVTYTNGDVIFSQTTANGGDCDDADPDVGAEDQDGDGVSACGADCDDTDPLNAAGFTEDCTDGQDNDCDGLADCDDSDCAASCFELDCEDGLDGDGDGDTDCDDSDCFDEAICIESDCGDGLDDDGDGDIDCDDSDCADNYTCQTSCVLAGYDLGTATGSGVASGTNVDEVDDFDGSCSTSVGGEDVTFSWTSPESGTYTFSTEGSDYDTVLYVSDSCVGEELSCNDDVDFNNGLLTSEAVNVFVAEGESVVVTIDAYDRFDFGTYNLDITATFEQSCDDGLDDDGDGVVDCADSDCSFDEACASLTCPNYDLGTATGTVMTGNLSGAFDDSFEPSCVSSFWSLTGDDYLVAWEAPESGCATLETFGSSTSPIITLFDDCPDNGGVELACSEYDAVEVDVTAGDVLYIGLDTYTYASSYNYALDIDLEANVSCN